MFFRSNDLAKARKILIAEVMRHAPCYYEQQFANNNYYGVGVDADGTVHGFGCAEDIDGVSVKELSLLDLGALLENDDPERLSLYEMRKRGINEIQNCLW